jgi:hypothetical protein
MGRHFGNPPSKAPQQAQASKQFFFAKKNQKTLIN